MDIEKISKAYTTATSRIQQYEFDETDYLDLSNLGLKTIPDELFQLEALRVLDLSGNYLSEIPQEISNLQIEIEPPSSRKSRLGHQPPNLEMIPNLLTHCNYYWYLLTQTWLPFF